MQSICEVRYLGIMPYKKAWELQEQLAGKIASGDLPPTLLLLEHPHTYTFGRSGHTENLLWDEAELTRRGVEVHWVDRGGDITYHGPGQLVGYPLLPLAPGGLHSGNSQQGRLPKADYVGYVRRLEMSLIKALEHLGVASRQIEGKTGVWVNAKNDQNHLAKIAAIGVKVDARGISRHGFALNINTDMSYWQGIIGCGLKDFAIANLADLVTPLPAMDAVMNSVTQSFSDVFDYRMVVTCI